MKQQTLDYAEMLYVLNMEPKDQIRYYLEADGLTDAVLANRQMSYTLIPLVLVCLQLFEVDIFVLEY